MAAKASGRTYTQLIGEIVDLGDGTICDPKQGSGMGRAKLGLEIAPLARPE